MRDLFTVLLILALIGVEAALWITNPLHIPAAFVPARALGVQVFQEMDGSMEPALAAGEHVLVSSWAYWKHEPQVGDVVAFQYPPDPSIADVKRIVAAGGSSVEIRNGTTYVDGQPTSEPYVLARVRLTPDSLTMRPMRVPAGSYFVMGDNRDRSRDSRDYGVIPRERLIGKLWRP